MDLHHDFTVPADVATTWATFMDLENVAGCFPGAAVTGVDGDSFTGTVKVKLGPIALVYAGKGVFVERDDATHRAVIEATGKDKRGNGTAGATVTIVVAPDGTGSAVDVTTDLNVTGKPAQFGRGVMQDVSDKLLGQFVACLERRFSEGDAPETAPESVADTGAPAAAASSDPAAAPVAAGHAATSATTPSGSAPAGAATPAAVPRPAPRPATRPAPEQSDALDLGSAVIPILLRTYAPHVGVLLVGILIGWRIGRR
ncbi:MAG: SRPBCC family protein [Actinomycetota bacterium]|nr:SRPBCC family protein [Actinomycetota bacterium]